MASGVLLIDKPTGITSHDVVSRIRRIAGTRRVGHAGTLDPAASGLLLLGIESSTRLLTYLVGLDKAYSATIRLGVATATDDAEGERTGGADATGLGTRTIADAVAALTGELEQVPSAVSAIKVDGRRAYARVRAGEAVQLQPRRVSVPVFEVCAERRGAAVIDLDVRVEVSSGTYVRALARDLGAGLGVGGHLTALRRTRVGPFGVADAVAPEDGAMDALRDPASVASAVLPVLHLDDAQLADLVHGRRVPTESGDLAAAAALTPDGRLAGVVAVREGRLRVLANLPAAEVLA
ncbi:MAG: tRNA pseudouridine(55) synthase TruB [Micrococcales bacterium]|nr:tRNA pseudouridine(55) synthase TruB [Micrococcales bacterium]